MTTLSRRKFLSMLAIVSAGTAVGPLGKLYAQKPGRFPAPGICLTNGEGVGFGPISPKLPLNAADLTSTAAGDLSQTALLELPEGFSYTALSITGQTMNDGARVHDGMACFQGRRGSHILVRNHELGPAENKFGSRVGCLPPNGNGDLFKFARNNFTTIEFCGACFSNDGRMMFVNIQGPGITYAIFRDDHRPILVKRPPR
jgi:secreted PhoX family phosphatase